MGCDIHFYVERKTASGAWESCDTWELDKYEDDPKPLTVPYGKHFYSERNYDLFAILANVRNGRGFAGIKTGDGFNVIAEPRGLPADMSPELTDEAGRCLEHTPSWLLVSEIMAFDWTQVVHQQGKLTPENYFEWSMWRKERGLSPESWFGDRSGPGIKDISEDQMRQLVTAAVAGLDHQARIEALKKLDRNQCLAHWTEPYFRAAGADFLANTLPRLWRLGSPDDVRCVFWFDS